jgi:2'-5' RNA ligase
MPAEQEAERVNIDLDGTLSVSGGTGPNVIAPMRPGARFFLEKLHGLGYEVVIFTARDVIPAKAWLRQNGLMRFVNDVTNTKLPSKVIVDDRAIRFDGDFTKSLKEIEDFKAHWETERKFSTTQVNLPAEVAEKVKALGLKIPDEELAEDGREQVAHITLKYGFHDDKPSDQLRDAVKKAGPIKARFSRLGKFSAPEHEVLILEVDSTDLHRLNKAVSAAMEHTDTHPQYKPHCTVAYVKPGTASKYLSNRELDGTEMIFTSVLWSGKDHSTEELPTT